MREGFYRAIAKMQMTYEMEGCGRAMLTVVAYIGEALLIDNFFILVVDGLWLRIFKTRSTRDIESRRKFEVEDRSGREKEPGRKVILAFLLPTGSAVLGWVEGGCIVGV